MFIENILGTESKVKLIRTLLEVNTAFTMEDLEKETGLSRGIIHRELNRLVDNIIALKVEKQGKLGYYKINFDNQYVQILTKLFELENAKERKNKIPVVTWNLLALITSKIISNNLEVSKLILFGSVARGTSTIRSDIDLMITGEFNRAKLKELIEEIQKKTKRKINISYITEKEYNGGTALTTEIKREGIILYENG
ncbi:nucleotidyltransferase domain-containing protein [archaeon]|nr:nucleotidyltransferase domain-containing protein [archaeon]